VKGRLIEAAFHLAIRMSYSAESLGLLPKLRTSSLPACQIHVDLSRSEIAKAPHLPEKGFGIRETADLLYKSILHESFEVPK
jgi:hypothetical protein